MDLKTVWQTAGWNPEREKNWARWKIGHLRLFFFRPWQSITLLILTLPQAFYKFNPDLLPSGSTHFIFVWCLSFCMFHLVGKTNNFSMIDIKQCFVHLLLKNKTFNEKPNCMHFATIRLKAFFFSSPPTQQAANK